MHLILSVYQRLLHIIKHSTHTQINPFLGFLLLFISDGIRGLLFKEEIFTELGNVYGSRVLIVMVGIDRDSRIRTG